MIQILALYVFPELISHRLKPRRRFREFLPVSLTEVSGKSFLWLYVVSLELPGHEDTESVIQDFLQYLRTKQLHKISDLYIKVSVIKYIYVGIVR